MTETQEPKSLAGESSSHEDLGKALRIVKTYGRSILLGVLGAVVVVAVVTFYQARKEAREADAKALLASARTAEHLRSIREQYAGTPVAAQTSLRLGGELSRVGNWGAALEEFQSFVRDYAEHPLAPLAAFNVALCLESLGRLEEAVEAYTRFEASNPEHFLIPQAILGRARCEMIAGRPEAARAIYEEILAAYPESHWAAQAESALLDLRARVGER